MPPPDMMMMRSPAASTNAATVSAPSSTVASWPGGEHALDAERDQCLKRRERIGSHVEGAVEGDRRGPRRARPAARSGAASMRAVAA